MISKWKKVASKIVHKNAWFSVRQDKVITPLGGNGQYNVIQRHPCVCIVPLNEDNEVYLIELFRYPTSRYSLEIPTGSSDGENILTAAKRELKEETGLVAKSWRRVGKFEVANGISNEIGYVYIARGLKSVPGNKQAEEGIRKVMIVPFKKALK
jgi:8-oxo-dGTP pyrophosphatase MutT (NUDIX family)